MAINFSEVKENDGEFKVMPEGRYNLVIESGTEKQSKAGNDMIEFQFKVIDGEFENRKVWDKFSLMEKAQPFLLRFLKAAGSDIVNSDKEVTIREIIEDAIGRNVSAFITTYTSNSGKTGNTIEGNYTPYEPKDTKPASKPKAEKETADAGDSGSGGIFD